jgi:hypothetical protein
MNLFAFTRHTGVRVAEIGFALFAIAGALLVVAQVVPGRRLGTIASGASLAAGSVIVLIAIRWGSFGSFF